MSMTWGLRVVKNWIFWLYASAFQIWETLICRSWFWKRQEIWKMRWPFCPKVVYLCTGADLGEGRGAGADASPSGIRHPADPKALWPTDPNRRQYWLILRGERTPKNAIFWSKFSKKCLKTPFLTVFFSKICLRRRIFFDKIGANTVLWESSKKSIWST